MESGRLPGARKKEDKKIRMWEQEARGEDGGGGGGIEGIAWIYRAQRTRGER